MGLDTAPTDTPGLRITGEDRTRLADELKIRYKAGESIRALAADTGRSYGLVRQLLEESGVTLRSRGGAVRTTSRKALNDDPR